MNVTQKRPGSSLTQLTTMPSRTPSTTPRKKPHCTHCGAPMLGHKRGQCNSQATPEKADADINETMQALRIQSEDDSGEDTTTPVKAGTPRRRLGGSKVFLLKNEHSDVKPTLRKSLVGRRASAPLEKAHTLLSLSPDDNEALAELSKPGIMRDDLDGNEGDVLPADIERWLETVPLSPPEMPRGRVVESHNTTGKSPSTSKYVSFTAKRLGKTSSMEERQAFLDILVEKSKAPVASVFTIAMSDIHELEASAKRLKFHARVIAPKYVDGSTGDGWLVIGRDGHSVDQIFETVEKELKGGKRAVRSAAGTIGGGAVGAVATWLYLAYS